MAMLTSPRKVCKIFVSKDCLLVARTDNELCLRGCKETIKRVLDTQIKKVLQALVVKSSLELKEVCKTTREEEEWMVVGFNVTELVKNDERETAFPADMSTTSVLCVIRTGVTLPMVEVRPADRVAVLWLDAVNMLVNNAVESLLICGDVEKNPGPGSER